MKATLIKEKEGVYSLLDGNRFISTTECKEDTPNKLSLKNCEAIANGYDLDELALKFMIDESYGEQSTDLWTGYIFGFQKALSILGNNRFSELDMRISYDAGCNNIDADYNIDFQDTINSLQQTEWDVEIVTELAYCKKEESGCKVYDQTKNSKDVFNLIYHCDGQIQDRFIHKESTGLKPTCVGYSKPMLDKDGCLILKRIDYGSI